jgi:glycosyltransferase involved in cell wall biosynthesis
MRIVGLAPNSWHGQWVNRQQLLSRLGRKHKVVYSTGAWSIWDRLSPQWRAATLGGRFEHADNVAIDEPPKLLLRWPKIRAFDEMVVRAHGRRLRRYAAADRSPLLALVFHPTYVEYRRHLRADLLAYHAYDLFEGTPGWDASMEKMERTLLKEADLVTAVSSSIAERLREKVDREIRILPNGVDLEAFDRSKGNALAIPDDLARIPRPRLGYVGSLHPQVDYALVAELAAARPEWHFVFVGGRGTAVDARAAREIEQCEQRQNVHFIGERHRNDVPAYISNMDANLMVYRLADRTWIKAIYPLKLHEYLAAGKPVVSADIPSVREFAAVVRIASGKEDWLRALDQALQSGGTGTEAERLAVAASNTWDARVARLDEWFGALAAARAP